MAGGSPLMIPSGDTGRRVHFKYLTNASGLRKKKKKRNDLLNKFKFYFLF
jgi:hypothetical protein